MMLRGVLCWGRTLQAWAHPRGEEHAQAALTPPHAPHGTQAAPPSLTQPMHPPRNRPQPAVGKSCDWRAALQAVGVDIFTLGQYLQPTPKHLEVTEFVTPEKFEHWRK